ncbi:double-strand break repair protein MRE11 [Halyomorpha halys]|uniref:double-strand break repair protein MRE11 n=1 Tax=Halyomorpha halys TaxID=286706 RepID=UPI0006D4F98B|nr:double-strand break repair protein MRE11 [Halyomorpha halys]
MDYINSVGDEDSVFKIMIATDIHLGVNEKNGIIGNDSFVTFEEILKISRDKEVDFILLGGDLFHENIPSTQCLHKCLSLLRKYTMGDKPITVSFDSNPEENFKHCDHKVVNYLDPNLNISIPVYSIHGNHDDPSGFGRMSALDILSTSGLINYFGKWTDLNNISLKPLLMSKGSSNLAIYGLSNIKDERLHRLFASNNVNFEATANHAKRFNILVLHQNRADRGAKRFIPEDFIPDFFDFVFWGHEHECRIEPEHNVKKGFVVVQPGSSVATSLCDGESVEKHVGILKIEGKKFELQQIKLKTVRPFVFETAKLADWNMKLPTNKTNEAVQDYVAKYIKNKMLPKAREQFTGHPDQPTLPLIRLRLEFTEEYEEFNTKRFSQSLSKYVANVDDAVLLKRDTSNTKRKRKANEYFDLLDEMNDSAIQETSVEDITEKLLDESVGSKKSLSMLLTRALTIGVKNFIDKGDKQALEDLVHHRIAVIKGKLKEESVSEDKIKESISSTMETTMQSKQKIEDDAVELLSSSHRSDRDTKTAIRGTITMNDDSDDDSSFGPLASSSQIASPPAKGRGSRGGRGARARGTTTTRARGRARGAANTSANMSMNISRYTRTIIDDIAPRSPNKKIKLSDNFVNDDDSD